MPVVHVEDGAQRFKRAVAKVARIERDGKNHDCQHCGQHRRYETAETPDPKRLQVQRVIPVVPTHEVKRDQVPREGEEHAHA